MPTTPPLDLDAPGLAQAIEQLAEQQINELPFGTIKLDPDGKVVFYSDVERQRAGFRQEAVNRHFFVDIAPCLDNARFRGRIEQAMAEGRLDISFDYTADLPGGAQDVDMRMRVVSATGGGCWVVQRTED